MKRADAEQDGGLILRWNQLAFPTDFGMNRFPPLKTHTQTNHRDQRHKERVKIMSVKKRSNRSCQELQEGAELR